MVWITLLHRSLMIFETNRASDVPVGISSPGFKKFFDLILLSMLKSKIQETSNIIARWFLNG